MKKKVLSIVCAVLLLAMLTGAVTAFASSAAVEPTLNIHAQNLSFKDSIYLQYAVSYADINTSDVKLLVWTAAQSEYTYGTQSAVLTSSDTQTVDGKTCLVFTYNKLAARQMTDNVYVRAYANVDGVETYSSVKKYSVLQYTYNKLGKTGEASTNEELKALLSAMLSYGAAAQNYTDYRTDSLATMDFYQVKTVGGLLDDGCDNGLYLPGTSVTMTAPATDANGRAFVGWQTSAGTTVGILPTCTVTVGEANEVYSAVYGAAPTANEYFDFTERPDGTYSIAAKDKSNMPAEVILPTSYNGKLVTAIADGAFSECADLEAISIPAGVTSIGNYAFLYCSSLTNISVADANTAYSDIDGNLYSKDGTALIQYLNAKAETSFTIPSGVTSVGTYALAGCNTLETVSIPASVTSIASDAFFGSVSLKAFAVDAANTAYAAIDGDLYSKGGETLYQYALGKSATAFTIPSGVTAIAPNALAYAQNLKSVNVADTVLTIGSKAFYNCIALKEIVLPESVTLIDTSAFEGCTLLSTVYYTGATTVDWSEMTINPENATLTAAERYYYSVTLPAAGDNYWRYVEGVPTIWVIEDGGLGNGGANVDPGWGTIKPGIMLRF